MNSQKRAFLHTRHGCIEIEGSSQGISAINFVNHKVDIYTVPACLKNCFIQLEEYFSGERHEFSIQLDLKGTPFQVKIWNELLTIPYGTTVSYLEMARRIGNAKAVRAVGGANGANPVMIVVPCHRVIGNNGKLVGYRGGLKRKKWLLEHEHAFSQRDLFYMKA